MLNHCAFHRLSGLAALAVLCGAAHAEPNVTISGFLDIGAYRGFNEAKNVGTVQRSNIAFSGKEDLGGGMAATFKLSHRLDLDTGSQEGAGSKPFWHGESTLGLKGSFGHIRLGRANDALSNNDYAFDPWENFNRIASPAWMFWHYNYASDRTSNNGSAEYWRLSNGVFYDSPTFNGFALHVSGAFENSNPAPGSGTGNNLGGALTYGQGPVTAMVGHSKNSSGDTVTFVGGKYNFGSLQVMGAYDNSVYKAVVDSKAKVYTLGAIYTVGAVAFKGGYGHLDLDGAKSSFVGLGADYSLSKRTTLYVSAGRSDPATGSTTHAYGGGISHSF